MVDLKGLLAGKDKDGKELFWAVIIEPDWIQAGVWQISEAKAQVFSLSPPVGWETGEELVGAVDNALSAAAQGLPEDAKEPSKTVFAVLPSWVSEGQIKEKYLVKLKRICSDLSLEPIGFVVLPEAIAHLVKSQEGSPLNAVLLGISKENLELSVFRLGSLVGSLEVARSVSLVDDVTEGLMRFTKEEPLPSRFLVYNGKRAELEDARQDLLKASWSELENIKLLHTPRIEILEEDKKILAASLAGASEISDIAEAQVIKEKELLEETLEEGKEVDEVAVFDEKVSPEDLGFAVGRDVLAQERKVETPSLESKEKDELAGGELPLGQEKKTKAAPLPLRGRLSWGILSKVKVGLSPILSRLQMRLVLGQTLSKKVFAFGVASFFLLILGGLFLWWFYPKAQVTVYVAPETLEEKVTIKVDPEVSDANFLDAILPGRVLSTSVSADKTKPTSGTKTVGERAGGEVTLYRVGPAISLPEETIIFGPDSLKFTLNNSVTVASGSASSPGSSKTKVTAADIGAQYNLAAGTSFSVGNYSVSDIEAKNESAFSGGSSREISAVATSDQEALEEELEEELVERAKGQLSEKLSAQELFVEGAVLATTSAKTFSAKVGDEASNLKLTLSLDVTGLSVERAALFSFAGEILKGKIPEGFVLREDQIEASFDLQEKRGREFTLLALVKANLLPEINPEDVAAEIIGKYPLVAQDFLTSIPGFRRAEIKLKPSLPGRLGTLPRVAKNIEIEIAAEN